MIPSKVKIGGLVYDVSLESKLFNADNTRLYGQIDYNLLTIKLEKDYAPQKQEATLWHEIIHGIAVEYGVELEEEDIGRIAGGVYQVIKDNPDLVNEKLPFMD
jgi:hypothetical protein